MQVTQSFRVPHPLERVEAVLNDTDYLVEREKLREGVISSRYELIQEREHEIIFELRTTEYKRKMTGGLDRSGTVETITKCRSDVTHHTSSWDYHGEAGKVMTLKGVYRLTANGDETQLIHDVTVEVKIPLIGKRIAKSIIENFDKPNPSYQELMDRYLAKP